MRPRPPIFTRTYTRLPYTALFRSFFAKFESDGAKIRFHSLGRAAIIKSIPVDAGLTAHGNRSAPANNESRLANVAAVGESPSTGISFGSWLIPEIRATHTPRASPRHTRIQVPKPGSASCRESVCQ